MGHRPAAAMAVRERPTVMRIFEALHLPPHGVRACKGRCPHHLRSKLEGTEMLSLLGATIAVMILFPETPTAKLLNRILVEEPARKLSELKWSKVVFGLVLCLLFVAFAYATVPLDLALFAAGDTAAYFEILTALWFVAANLRLRATLRRIGSEARRAAQWALAGCRIVRAHVSARVRSRSSRKRLTSTRDRDDDSAAPDLVFA